MPYLHERQIILNTRHKSDQFYTICKHKGYNFILCINLNENEMLVYTEVGILCTSIDYSHVTEEYGLP